MRVEPRIVGPDQRRGAPIFRRRKLHLRAQHEHPQAVRGGRHDVSRREQQPAIRQAQHTRQRAYAAFRVVPARQRRARAVERIDGAAQLTLQKRSGVRAAHLDAALLGLWTVTRGHFVARRPAVEIAADVSILPAFVATTRRSARLSADTCRFWQTLPMPGEHKQERIEGDSTPEAAGSRRSSTTPRTRSRETWTADATASTYARLGGRRDRSLHALAIGSERVDALISS